MVGGMTMIDAAGLQFGNRRSPGSAMKRKSRLESFGAPPQ